MALGHLSALSSSARYLFALVFVCLPLFAQDPCPYVRVAPRLILTGPTTVGKTKVVVAVLNGTDAHVINGDKMYFYDGGFSICSGLSDIFGVQNSRTHLYRVLEPLAPTLDENVYVEKVKDVLREVGDSTPVLFDGASRNYLQPLENAVPGIWKVGLRWPEGYDVRGAIAQRVEKAVAAGLVEETQRLIAEGKDKSPAFQESPVYKIVERHLKGDLSLEKMKLALVEAGYGVAENQIRSLSKMPGIIWIDADPAKPEVTAAKVQSLLQTGTLPLGSGTVEGGRFELHRPVDKEFGKLGGIVQQGYALAAARYKEAYPQHADKIDGFFNDEYQRLAPERTSYATVAKTIDGVESVTGFGMLYDGRVEGTPASSDRKRKKWLRMKNWQPYHTPTERFLPAVNLRLTPDGKPTNQIMEMGRLATLRGQGSMEEILTAMAEGLRIEYGGFDKIPEDLTIIAVCENELLANFYEKKGFPLKYSAVQTGRPDKWVVNAYARDICVRYGGAVYAPVLRLGTQPK